MTVIIATAVGLLIGVGVLHLLQRDVVRIVIGLYVVWNALNLFLVALAMPGSTGRTPLEGGEAAADPLLHALVLTAIIVTFGFTAFLLTLVSWLARRGESIDLRHFCQGKG